MKTLFTIILSLGLFTDVSNEKDINEMQVETVVAFFDAYEGGAFFFTDKEKGTALTLIAKDKSIVRHYGLLNSEPVGELFKIVIVKEKDVSIIKHLEKL